MSSNGVATIDPDGSGAEPSFRAFCLQADNGQCRGPPSFTHGHSTVHSCAMLLNFDLKRESVGVA